MKLSATFNRKLIQYLIIYLTTALSIQLIKKINWKLNNGLYKTWNWFEFFLFEFFAEWIVIVGFMIAAYYFTNRMIERNMNMKVILFIHLLSSALLGFVTLLSITTVAYIFGAFNINEAIENISWNNFLSGLDKDFLIYFSSISIIYVYSYINKVKDAEIQKSQLQTQLVTSKLNRLRTQIQPHFMFNTLNSISSLMEIDIEKSQNLIADFGDLFRRSMEFSDTSVVHLRQELEFLEKYIDIISVRFSDHLKFHKEIEDNIDDAFVPCMIIQPLIENAVKHGYSYHNTEIEIYLSVYKASNNLHIDVINNGKLLDTNFEELFNNGTGLRLTEERLKTLYNNDFQFTLVNKPDLTSVVASIRIPYTV
jgi:sensor histidine kinase YesM